MTDYLDRDPEYAEVETASGFYLDVMNPKSEQIMLEDIAQALSRTCRFGGHCSRYYSVAEHALLCHDAARRLWPSEPMLALGALHHDDHEAYIGDVPRPIKKLLGSVWQDAERRLDACIIDALGFPLNIFEDSRIKDIDNSAVCYEASLLMPSKGKGWHIDWDLDVEPTWDLGEMSQREVMTAFLHRHKVTWRDYFKPQKQGGRYL